MEKEMEMSAAHSSNQKLTPVRFQPIRKRLTLSIKAADLGTWLSYYLDIEQCPCQNDI